MELLKVCDLSIEYKTGGSLLKAVTKINFSLEKGITMGVVGESGCGKSTLIKAILGLIPENGRVSSGKVLFDGQDLVPMTYDQLRSVRWRRIALINQAAMNAFNPVHRVGEQLIEVMTVQGNMSRKDARKRAEYLFDVVGLEAKRLSAYPHQLSGGMRQRCMIAMSLALEPDLIIADEPTTALDVVVQDRILRKIKDLQAKSNISLMFVTHDISVVAEICEKTMVMYAGQIAEAGSTREIFKSPYHPYTLGLINAFPNVIEDIPQLISIPGYPPDLTQPLQGCLFAPRCPFSKELCSREEPGQHEVEPGHFVACHFTEKVGQFRSLSSLESTWKEVAA